MDSAGSMGGGQTCTRRENGGREGLRRGMGFEGGGGGGGEQVRRKMSSSRRTDSFLCLD